MIETLAQAVVAPPSVWTLLLGYGPLGIIVIGTMVGWWFPKPHVDRLERENERLRLDNERVRAENTALRVSIEERVVPALIRVTDTMNRMGERVS